MRSNGPANDQAIEAAHDGREVHLAGRDLELGDVGEPLLIRRCGVEVTIDGVLGRWTDLPQIGADRRRFGFETTRLSCFINRCTTFSELVTHCLVSEACRLRYGR